MEYRDSYRGYERPAGFDDPASAYKHPIEDAFDRSRKRGRSPSPTFDRYASERRASAYGAYPPAPGDAWDREREYPPPAVDGKPYVAAARGGYDDYGRGADPYERDRERALEWERYYRERDPAYLDDYGASDRDRYEARRRYDDEDPRDRHYRERDRGFAAYGDVGPAASATPQRRGGPDYGRDVSGSAYRNGGGEALPPPDPMQSETLLPFRAFAQMTKAAHPSAKDRSIDVPTTQELYEGYQVYRLAFSKRAMQAFFERRKDEPWFQEKYSAAEGFVAARQKRKRAGRLGRKEAWLEELASGKLDAVNFDLKVATEASSGLSADAAGVKVEGEAEGLASDRHGDVDDEGADPDAREGRNGRDDHRDVRRPRAESVRIGDPVLTTRYGGIEPIPGEQVPIPASDCQLLVTGIPSDIPRAKLEEHLQSRPGFRYLALGEPHAGKRWHRVGWAMYDEGTDMEETARALEGKDIDGYAVHVTVSARPASGKVRSVPEFANSFVRLQQDLKQVKALVAKFEEEDRTVLFRDEAEEGAAWLQTNASDAILARHRELEPELGDEVFEQGYDADEEPERREARRAKLKKHLDWHLDLLRTVYHTDYYLSLICEFGEELLRRSPRHARRQAPPGVLCETPRESTNDESWSKSVDQKATLLLTDDKSDLTEFGGKSVDAEMMAAALPFVKEEEKEKHRCVVEVAGAQCGKLFKAAIFVQKHVLNKHRAFLESHAEQPIQETRFFNNYVRDPCRPQALAGHSGPGGGAGTPLSQRFGGATPMDASPGAPSPLFNSSRVGLIRLGGSTAAMDSPSSTASYGRRATSPGRRLGERIGGVMPSAAVPMAGNGGYASPSSASLSMRIGGLAPNGSPAADWRSGTVKLPAEPLPDPPKPLDPRASRTAAINSYTDLDGPAQGDVDDLAY
ncbi:uncharacterized protein PFL1_06647 [Pseudozyma flocculosa PF-1]|uniref:SERRATE/Ars2 N-terminal domain-containing protein n=1 Tax=Pseudozyma flocculosa PF-1 TaxID=1277687 RepID=A0A061H1X0_9BASI|nr:uncharacterized protein PFL1_06647 [Pseudozyma flocculosa PF-1]EPQ25780.1 hypothetical protein PFL1_06647 [Pseudozyma flocculosa PF-1]